MNHKKYYLVALIAVVAFALLGNNAMAKSEKFSYEDIIRLEKVVSKISEFYVEEISSEDLVKAAVEGVRLILDPHTAYFSEKEYTSLKVSTEGAFGGLGITIAVRERMLTVISPLQGTPAYRMGLQAGDQITEIDGKSTKGITVDDAVDKLRGKPGTPVTIKVYREGNPEIMEFTIVREVIRIQSVPFATMLNDSVGFVKVTQFSKQTGEDLAQKILSLKKQGMKSLILDLRNNPGGLLNQAIEVSELFLEKNKMVVFTKGRTSNQNKDYLSNGNALLDKNSRLIVLINQGSASASEIVAGAMQDHDRGLILGQTSFGKGSVQTILPLDAQKYALKLTTAYYYTPSGRCINKPENGVRALLDEETWSEDGESEKPKSKADSTKTFNTDSGRKVLAGGGIEPDVKSELDIYTRFVRELERKTMFFKYIIKNRHEIEKSGKVTLDYQVPETMVEEFRKFIFADTSFASYKNASQIMLGEFQKTLKKEREANGDTLPNADNQEIDKIHKDLEKKLADKSRKEFDLNRGYISFALKRELVQAAVGDSARSVHELSRDHQVKDALSYMVDPVKYRKMIAKH